MPHCIQCGAEVLDTAKFCQKCGRPQPVVDAAPSPQWSPPVSTGGAFGLSENAAAALSYVLGWLSGIIFFLVDKRPYVRFHAAQSIVTFAGLHILRAIIGVMFGLGWMAGWRHDGYGFWGGWGIGIAFLSVLGIVTFVLWIVCMIKAAQGERFRVPFAGDIAENLAGR